MLPTTQIQGGGGSPRYKRSPTLEPSRGLKSYPPMAHTFLNLVPAREVAAFTVVWVTIPSNQGWGGLTLSSAPPVVVPPWSSRLLAYALELAGTIVNAVSSLTFLRLRNATPETSSPHQQDTLYKLCCVLVYSNASTCKLLIGRHSNIARMNLAGCIYLAVEFDIHIE